jgi:hypothetical protein
MDADAIRLSPDLVAMLGAIAEHRGQPDLTDLFEPTLRVLISAEYGQLPKAVRDGVDARFGRKLVTVCGE